MSVALSYSMIISWSDEDRAFLVRLPEFGPGAMTHGDTYEEAAKHGQEVLEMLVESYIEDGQALPKPDKFESIAHAAPNRNPSRLARKFKGPKRNSKQKVS
jgi:predicted RNase H-like HicB family nuclease